MTRYMLDTNMVGHLIRGARPVADKVRAVPMAALCVSAVTAGELHYGLAHNPTATRLHRAVAELLLRVEVLAWDRDVAALYGRTRAELRRAGRTVTPLDLMIAAHALWAGTVLVTNDKAFRQVDGLTVEDWSVADPPG